MFKAFKVNGTTKEIYFVCVAFLSFLFCGINRAYLAFLFHQLDSSDSEITLDDEQKSLIAAYSSLLSPLGCIIMGICVDFFGRRRTLQLVYIPFIVSWILIACAKNVVILYTAFLGFGIGVGMALCAVGYATEICTAKHRGSLLVVLLIDYNLGALCSNYLMYLLRWNIVAIIFAASAASVLILTYFLPESPIWLCATGQEEKFIETLCRIRCEKMINLEYEIQDIKNYCALQEKNNLTKIIRNCINARRQILLACLSSVGAGGSGYILWQIFGIMMLKRLDIPYNSENIMVIYSIVTMITCLVAPYILHKIPRKKILCASSLIMALCLLVIGLYQEFHQDNVYAWVIPVSLFTYSAMLNFGIVPLAFSTPGELLPSASKGVSSGIVGSFSYLYFTVLQKIFPGFLSICGVIVTMYTLSACCVLLALYAIFILPETKGKSLNQIQEEYFRVKTANNN